MAETTTGTGMYSVAPTVLPTQGQSPHEVLAQQSADAQKAKAMANAQEAKKRETAMANAAATMERLNAENWKTDSNYFGRRRSAMTDHYTEILKRSNGNPTTEDMAELNDAAMNYEIESNYSMQTQDEFKTFEGILSSPDKSSQYTPESIDENAAWYQLPFEERLVTPKPRLSFIPEIEDWKTGFDKELGKWKLAKTYASKDEKDGFIVGSTGRTFNEETFLPAAENYYALGLVNPNTGQPAVKSVQLMIDDITAPHSAELANITDHELRKAAKKEIVVDWMRNQAKAATQVGRTGKTMSGVPGAGDDKDGGPYEPQPAVPGKITFDDTTHDFVDTYTVGVGESVGDPKSMSVARWYNPETKKMEKGDLVELKDGVDIFEKADGTKYMKAKVDVETTGTWGDVSTHNETRVIEITPDVDKKLRNSSDQYRKRMEYFENKTSQTSSGGTSR